MSWEDQKGGVNISIGGYKEVAGKTARGVVSFFPKRERKVKESIHK